MKKPLNLLYWFLILAALLFMAYSKGWIFSPFESISPREAESLLRTDHDVTLLDVRTPREYAQEHLEGAVLIPVQSLENDLDQLESSKGKEIIVYCHSGNRSVTASRILVQHGFTPLNMKGGIDGWKEEGFKVVR